MGASTAGIFACGGGGGGATGGGEAMTGEGLTAASMAGAAAGGEAGGEAGGGGAKWFDPLCVTSCPRVVGLAAGSRLDAGKLTGGAAPASTQNGDFPFVHSEQIIALHRELCIWRPSAGTGLDSGMPLASFGAQLSGSAQIRIYERQRWISSNAASRRPSSVKHAASAAQIHRYQRYHIRAHRPV